MEKNTPHYDLAVIQEDVVRLGAKAFTRTARETAFEIGFDPMDMQEVILKLQRNMLHKSMTTYDDHRVWQDVYHIASHGREIYIKVSYCYGRRPPVISFKEKKL